MVAYVGNWLSAIDNAKKGKTGLAIPINLPQ